MSLLKRNNYYEPSKHPNDHALREEIYPKKSCISKHSLTRVDHDLYPTIHSTKQRACQLLVYDSLTLVNTFRERIFIRRSSIRLDYFSRQRMAKTGKTRGHAGRHKNKENK